MGDIVEFKGKEYKASELQLFLLNPADLYGIYECDACASMYASPKGLWNEPEPCCEGGTSSFLSYAVDEDFMGWDPVEEED